MITEQILVNEIYEEERQELFQKVINIHALLKMWGIKEFRTTLHRGKISLRVYYWKPLREEERQKLLSEFGLHEGVIFDDETGDKYYYETK